MHAESTLHNFGLALSSFPPKSPEKGVGGWVGEGEEKKRTDKREGEKETREGRRERKGCKCVVRE